MHCCLMLATGHVICRNHSPAPLGVPQAETRMWAVHTPRDSRCHIHHDLRACSHTGRRPDPMCGFSSSGVGSSVCSPQVMLMVQGPPFEKPLLQGKFLGTFWNPQRIPRTGSRQNASCPEFSSEFPGILKDAPAETPPGARPCRP